MKKIRYNFVLSNLRCSRRQSRTLSLEGSWNIGIGFSCLRFLGNVTYFKACNHGPFYICKDHISCKGCISCERMWLNGNKKRIAASISTKLMLVSAESVSIIYGVSVRFRACFKACSCMCVKDEHISLLSIMSRNNILPVYNSEAEVTVRLFGGGGGGGGGVGGGLTWPLT